MDNMAPFILLCTLEAFFGQNGCRHLVKIGARACAVGTAGQTVGPPLACPYW